MAKLSKDNAEENPEEEPVKVHEIKFDEYGIMDDGVDATTNEQLKALGKNLILNLVEMYVENFFNRYTLH